jgi:hypothetical protein
MEKIIQFLSFVYDFLPRVIAILKKKRKSKKEGTLGAKALCDGLKISGGVAFGVFIVGMIQSDGSLPLVQTLAGIVGVALVSIGYLVELAEKLPKPAATFQHRSQMGAKKHQKNESLKQRRRHLAEAAKRERQPVIPAALRVPSLRSPFKSSSAARRSR